MPTPKILVLPGSTRAGSHNVRLAALAVKELTLLDADVTRISLDSQAEKVAKILSAGGNCRNYDFQVFEPPYMCLPRPTWTATQPSSQYWDLQVGPGTDDHGTCPGERPDRVGESIGPKVEGMVVSERDEVEA